MACACNDYLSIVSIKHACHKSLEASDVFTGGGVDSPTTLLDSQRDD